MYMQRTTHVYLYVYAFLCMYICVYADACMCVGVYVHAVNLGPGLLVIKIKPVYLSKQT